MSAADLQGWIVRDKGLTYLASDHGWLELHDADGRPWGSAGLRHQTPVRLIGRRKGAAVVVERLVSAGTPSARRPPFVVNPPDRLFLADRARRAAHEVLAADGFLGLTLPSAWTLSREYGEEELRISHSRLGRELFLLQSPEFPMYAALAGGIGRFFGWGRCFRFDEGEPASRYLMEFEQIDIGGAHMELTEMMALTERVVRAVAEAIGVPIDPGAFEVRCTPPVARDEGGTDLLVLSLPASFPSRARALVLERLHRARCTVEVLGDRDLAVRWAGDSAEVRRVVDAVDRIAATRSDASEAPRWESPLPLEPGPGSEYTVGAITSARRTMPDGTSRAEEAELYLFGCEIAHAGLFADAAQFRANLDEAGVTDGRFDWLLALLEDAPPRMAKVGIGWERLLGSLLGGVEPASFLPFPRSGTGHVLFPAS